MARLGTDQPNGGDASTMAELLLNQLRLTKPGRYKFLCHVPFRIWELVFMALVAATVKTVTWIFLSWLLPSSFGILFSMQMSSIGRVSFFYSENVFLFWHFSAVVDLLPYVC